MFILNYLIGTVLVLPDLAASTVAFQHGARYNCTHCCIDLWLNGWNSIETVQFWWKDVFLNNPQCSRCSSNATPCPHFPYATTTHQTFFLLHNRKQHTTIFECEAPNRCWKGAWRLSCYLCCFDMQHATCSTIHVKQQFTSSGTGAQQR